VTLLGAPQGERKIRGRLHGQGFRHFDFSIGNYPYKRRLGVEAKPLCDLVTALSPRGLPLQFWDRAAHLIRRNPSLHGLARRALRRPVAKDASNTPD
jgi:CelD/BcsL family acetyltransferase involved in cellulose biosynthesis